MQLPDIDLQPRSETLSSQTGASDLVTAINTYNETAADAGSAPEDIAAALATREAAKVAFAKSIGDLVRAYLESRAGGPTSLAELLPDLFYQVALAQGMHDSTALDADVRALDVRVTALEP